MIRLLISRRLHGNPLFPLSGSSTGPCGAAEKAGLRPGFESSPELPERALYDSSGGKYGIERYMRSESATWKKGCVMKRRIFTPASQTRLKARTSPAWKELGLGVSKSPSLFLGAVLPHGELVVEEKINDFGSVYQFFY